jgi:threonine dehydrogenase-like Zn-dependent dehydrogenase
MHYEEVDHIGAFHYGLADVRAAWALLLERRVRIEPLVTHHRPLAAFDEALQLALDRSAIKVAVHP